MALSDHLPGKLGLGQFLFSYYIGSMLIPTQDPDLVLRSWRLSDRDNLKDVADSGNIAQFMKDEFPHPFTKSAASEYLGEIGVPHADTHFALEWQGKVIGEIHYNPQSDILKHSCFLGYWVGEEYWGKGFMSSAVKTLVNWIFRQTELVRIVARVFSNNFGSIKVLEKNGFSQEGYFPKAVLKNGKLIDQVQYSLLKPNLASQITIGQGASGDGQVEPA